MWWACLKGRRAGQDGRGRDKVWNGCRDISDMEKSILDVVPHVMIDVQTGINISSVIN